ncbi:MAG: glycosyltransferase family 2 protein [Simkania sp.]|nr:glycosyltransferase family 2 protein [Simkania sp.]
MSQIRLSVAMANYNHGMFLEERISSILEQLEADDASTDQSVSVIEKFAVIDTRVRLICNTQNMGVVKSANRAFSSSRGRYLCSLSAGDRILPGFIDKTLGVLLEQLDIAICCSACAIWFDGFPDKDPQEVYVDPLIDNAKEILVFRPQQVVKIFRTTSF